MRRNRISPAFLEVLTYFIYAKDEIDETNG
ncbi:hypothetical protein DEU44_1319 [Priestia megaterium]|nr:hypothetical protein DEU44_1319 [Priestia megaterium]